MSSDTQLAIVSLWSGVSTLSRLLAARVSMEVLLPSLPLFLKILLKLLRCHCCHGHQLPQ
jgi:hypothetical protein